MATIEGLVAAQAQAQQAGQQLGILPALIMQQLAELFREAEHRRYREAQEGRAESAERRAEEAHALEMAQARRFDPERLLALQTQNLRQQIAADTDTRLQSVRESLEITQRNLAQLQEQLQAETLEPSVRSAQAGATTAEAEARIAEPRAEAELRGLQTRVEDLERQPERMAEAAIAELLNAAVTTKSQVLQQSLAAGMAAPGYMEAATEAALAAARPHARAALGKALNLDPDLVGGEEAKKERVRQTIAQLQAAGFDDVVKSFRAEALFREPGERPELDPLLQDPVTGQPLPARDLKLEPEHMQQAAMMLFAREEAGEAVQALAEGALAQYDADQLAGLRDMVATLYVEELEEKAREGSGMSTLVFSGLRRMPYTRYRRVPEPAAASPEDYRTVEYEARRPGPSGAPGQGSFSRKEDISSLQDAALVAASLGIPEAEWQELVGQLIADTLRGKPEEALSSYANKLRKTVLRKRNRRSPVGGSGLPRP